MYPVPLPTPPALYLEISHQIPQAWHSFDLSYEGMLAIVSRLEKLEEIAETISEDEFKRLRSIVIYLVQLGSLNATASQLDLLDYDISQLFVDDDEFLDDDDLEAAAAYNPNFPNDAYILPCKSLRKRVKQVGKALKKAAKKVVKFVKEHRKEFITAGVAVAGVGAAYYLLADHGEHIEEPQGPGRLSEPERRAETPTKELPPVKEESTTQETPVLQPKPAESFSEWKFKDEIKEMGALVAHHIWNGVAELGSIIPMLEQDLLDLGKLATRLGPSVTPNDQLLEGPLFHAEQDFKAQYNQKVAEIHQKIDDWFSTDQGHLFDEEYKRRKKERVTAIGLPPPLFGHLKEAKEVARIASVIRQETIAEELSLAARNINSLKNAGAVESRVSSATEGILAKQSPIFNPIRSKSDGIWEIEGKSIKRFDTNRIGAEDGKLEHLFKQEHKLNVLGNSNDVILEKITKAVADADIKGLIPLNQHFERRIIVEGHEVEVRGIVLNGELRYGTFFIPK
jgi:hypothetical protein